MTFEKRVQGFRLHLLRWPQELGNRGPRDMPPPDCSGWSVRIEVGWAIDRELARSLSGLSETPHDVACRKEPA